MIENCFEKIINNYLESTYLTILLDVKDPRLALLVIFKSVDKALSNDNNVINFPKKLHQYVAEIYKQTIDNYSEVINNYKNDISNDIPSILYMLNFGAYKLFNEFDNRLLIGTIILKKDLNEMASLIDEDINIVIDRYFRLISQIKTMFYEKVRDNYLKEIRLE